MFRVAALLLQLTLWVATVHAFFPFIPEGHCAPDDHYCGSVSGSKRSDGSDPTSDAITVSLHHRPAGRDDPAKADPVADAARRLAHKFRRPPPSPTSGLEKRKNIYPISEPAAPTTSNSAGIYNYGPDYSYFIQARVGSAQQPFYMLLDTGAANTWLMGSNCASDACNLHNTFDAGSSKSWEVVNNGFFIGYGTGNLTGVVGKDTATFAGLTLDLSFGLANHTDDQFKHFAFDGILGLGMGASVTGTFMQDLKAKKLLSSLVFSISLDRGSDGVNDGQITFGGVDPAKYTGDISYHTIEKAQKDAGQWAIKMDGVSFNGKSAGISSNIAFIDTGTSFVFAPPADLDALFKLVPGSITNVNKLYVEYEVPCDTKLPLQLSFSGINYEIPAKDWVMKKDETKCMSALYGWGEEGHSADTWLVGDTFLKNVYSVFDADKMRIGFASKPPPPPKPTSTSAGAAATTLSTAVTSLAGDDSAHPLMPGLSSGDTAGSGSAQTVTSPPAEHTQTNSGNQRGGEVHVSVLCIVAAIAMWG